MCAWKEFCTLTSEGHYPQRQIYGGIDLYPNILDAHLLLNLPSAAQLPAERRSVRTVRRCILNVEPIMEWKGDGGNHKLLKNVICGWRGEISVLLKDCQLHVGDKIYI